MSSKKRKLEVHPAAASAAKDLGSKATHSAAAAAADTTAQGADAFNNPRTVYLEGLPFDASEDDVRAFFGDVGGSIRALRLPRWHDSGRLRGYGHVEFADENAATRALELNGNYMGKRFIKVEAPMTPRALAAAASAGAGAGAAVQGRTGKAASSDNDKLVHPPGCRTIFVKNLPYDCSEDNLREAFKVYGKISSVRIARWNHTNQSKGFGYVEFVAENSANIAVRKSGEVVLSGRVTMCDFDTGRVKGSFRPPPGTSSSGGAERGFKKRKVDEQS